MTEDNRIENANVEVAKALASLAAADHLIAMGLRDDAMSRLYYAAFHLASAALLALGVEATTHRGLLALFSQHAVRPGMLSSESARILASLAALRNQADYNRHFVIDEVGAREERERAQRLVDEITAFLRARGIGPR